MADTYADQVDANGVAIAMRVGLPPGLRHIDWNHVPQVSLARVTLISVGVVLWALLLLVAIFGLIGDRGVLILCVVFPQSLIFLFNYRDNMVPCQEEIKKMGDFYRQKFAEYTSLAMIIFIATQMMREFFREIWTPTTPDDWTLIFVIWVFLIAAPKIWHKNWLCYRYGRYSHNVLAPQ